MRIDVLKKFNVLYIEDDVDLQRNTVEVLEDFVNKLYYTDSLNEAYKIIKTKHIDLVISDILVGEKNAIEFIEFLKKQNINIPFILISAYTNTEYFLDAIKLKVASYLIKPVKMKQLLENMYEVLYPKYQEKEILKDKIAFKVLSMICDSKQMEVIKLIIDSLDEEYVFSLSYQDIMQRIDISKPTLIKLFKQLLEKEIIIKLPKRKYKFNIYKLDLFQKFDGNFG